MTSLLKSGASTPPGRAPKFDRHERESPSEPDLRFDRVHSAEQPEADVLEEMSVVEIGEIPAGVDEARLEPIDEEDRFDEETGH
jgi:hypothetical protein